METQEKKQEIDFNEFLEIEKKLDIRYGNIIEVEKMEKSDKMLKLQVDFGDETRTVMTNIGNRLDAPQNLVGYQLPFIMNLKPVKIMGVESTAMIMVVENEDGKLLFEKTHYPKGSKLF